MAIRLTDLGALAMAMMVITILLVYMRPKIVTDSNWPLLYFFALVVYQKMYDDIMSPYPIFVGVMCAAMIRFEFMSARFVKYFRWLETLTLVYVLWRLLGFLLYF